MNDLDPRVVEIGAWLVGWFESHDDLPDAIVRVKLAQHSAVLSGGCAVVAQQKKSMTHFRGFEHKSGVLAFEKIVVGIAEFLDAVDHVVSSILPGVLKAHRLENVTVGDRLFDFELATNGL